MKPDDVAPASRPPKSRANAPARYEYGPNKQKATIPNSARGAAGALPRGITVRTARAAPVAARPTHITTERPASPSRSPSHPTMRTDAAPASGKIALVRAALPAL